MLKKIFTQIEKTGYCKVNFKSMSYKLATQLSELRGTVLDYEYLESGLCKLTYCK